MSGLRDGLQRSIQLTCGYIITEALEPKCPDERARPNTCACTSFPARLHSVPMHANTPVCASFPVRTCTWSHVCTPRRAYVLRDHVRPTPPDVACAGRPRAGTVHAPSTVCARLVAPQQLLYVAAIGGPRCSMCNTRSNFKTSRCNIWNIHLKTDKILETCV
jgi:hypothetical protein